MSSMSARCNDHDSMETSLSNGVEAPQGSSPYNRTQVHPQMEANLAPSLSRAGTSAGHRRRSVSPDSKPTQCDMNQKLTYPSSPDRLKRPHTLSPLPKTTQLPPSPFAIQSQYNNHNTYYSQDVRDCSVNASSAPNRPNIPSTSAQNVSPHHSAFESGHFPSTSSNNVSINNNYTRPYRTNQVFKSTSDLAAHYGLPTFLPPAPRTTPRRTSDTVDSNIQQSSPDFAFLCSNYLNMLSQKPGESPSTAEDSRTTSVGNNPSFVPSPSDNEAVKALMAVLKDTASPQELPTSSDMSEFLTSPFDDSPLEDFLTTPLMDGMELSNADVLTSPIIDSWGVSGDIHGSLFADGAVDSTFEGIFNSTKTLVDPTPTNTIDANQMWTISPSTPALDSPAREVRPLPSSRRKSNPTGTRKNINPESLVPIDAPTQPRKYTTPSVTSRKDVPAVFARKRARQQAFDGEQDELDDEVVQLPPNPTEQELIEAKRRQNTIAARRSRKRKLEYQRELEDQVETLKQERDDWKLKALTYHTLLVNHGIEAPTYFGA